MKKQVAYIALGSNLGDKRLNIARAIQLIGKIKGIKVTKISRIIKTLAEGKFNQPNFLNAVVKINTFFSVEKLWQLLSQIEKYMGRVRSRERSEPRVIDLDILLFGQKIYESSSLIIPHPRMHRRLFVLKPLCEIAPGIIHPKEHKSVKALLKTCI